MAIMNLTPDSFWAESRADASEAVARVERFVRSGASIVDIGAVSSRPGASPVSLEEEWSRLEPALKRLSGKVGEPVALRGGGMTGLRFSIDSTRHEIIRRSFELLGPTMIANDISAGEDDPGMLPTVADLGLTYVAMHKRGGPSDMDALCDYSDFATEEYPSGVIPALLAYFTSFASRAYGAGVNDWILDPGLGFAKTADQCLEILENLPVLKQFGRLVLIGAAHKRFTGGDSSGAEALAIEHGADILRVHI